MGPCFDGPRLSGRLRPSAQQGLGRCSGWLIAALWSLRRLGLRPSRHYAVWAAGAGGKCGWVRQRVVVEAAAESGPFVGALIDGILVSLEQYQIAVDL